MDFLKEELERKRKALEQLAGPGKKYVKRGDLEKAREQQYREEQERLERERQEKLQKRLAEVAERETGLSRSGTPETGGGIGVRVGQSGGTGDGSSSANDVIEDEDEFNIPNDEVVRRFRARDQPIRLFGETDRQRIRRLRKLESTEERTEGQRNDFRAAMQATDKGLALENLIRKHSREEGDDSTPADDNNQYTKKSSKKDTTSEVDTTLISLDLLQKDPEKVRSLIAVYFKRVLREWERSLTARPDEVKRSTQGKLAAATQAQSAEYLKPFFKQLKRGQIAEDVVARIAEICQFMQQREYLQANDAYLRMSIGNAPWPIGVTMVGIHERSAREKIFASQVAHVLNDEAQRKWIQTIKRMMTFAQTRWPPDDGAKRVG
ncbi:mRNA splicing protein prp18 [Rhizophlyctis rosea]|nr:mRNA splicing protein prp18 [Rhizophlyctis rosea]